MSRWREAPVTVVGCGGLGVPAAWTLAHAGAKQLRLIDADTVDVTNLHRQVLFSEADCGLPKASRLAAALQARFTGLQVTCVAQRLGPHNTEELLAGCDVVVEGSDDAVAKFAVSDWASTTPSRSKRSAVIAAAIGRRGQWMVVHPGGACYRCLFEQPPPPEMLATCAVAGVLGPVVGAVGALAARSLIQTLDGHGDPAASALIRWLPGEARSTAVRRAPDCPCALAGLEEA